MAKKTRKRWLALMMALVMAVGVLPVSALADGTDAEATQTDKQIVDAGGTSYYLANGTAGTESNYDVSVKKVLTATGIENEFNVEVQVTYKNQSTTTVIADAAIDMIGKLAADLGLELKSGSAEDVDAGEAEGAYGGVDE